MIYLLIATALCLLVPWLPWLVYRRLPRRPLPPLAEEQLHQLATELQRCASQEDVAAAIVEEEQTRTEVTLRRGATPNTKAERSEARTGEAEPQQDARNRATPATRASVPPRLTFPSYGWVNIVLVAILIVTFNVLGGGFAVLFHYLGNAHARSFQPTLFLFKPFCYGAVCVLPAFLLGICSSSIPTMLLARLFLGDRRFHEYLFWDEGRIASHGGFQERIIKGFALVARCVGVLSVLYIWQVMSWYLSCTEDHIAIKRLIRIGAEVHPYSRVDQIVLTSHQAHNGNVWPKEELHIRFRDGRTWDTDDTFRMPHGAERDYLLDLLQRKTGKSIIHARLIQDVPGW